MSIKLLFVGDIHYSLSNPASRSDNYHQAIVRKLHEIMELTIANQVSGVFFTGDFFHKKRPSFHEANSFIDIFKSFEVPVYGIFGNHDIFNMDSIAKRAAGSMIASEAIMLLDGAPVVWQDLRLQVSGKSFSIASNEFPHKEVKNLRKIHLTHLDIYLTNPGSHIPHLSHKYLRENLHYDILFNGHVHNDPGAPKKRIGKTMVYNLGSIGRVASNETHQPKVLLLTVTKKAMKEKIIELKSARPANEVFIEKEEATDERNDIVKFAKELIRKGKEKNEEDIKVLLAKLAKKFGGKKAYKKALEYIEKAEA